MDLFSISLTDVTAPNGATYGGTLLFLQLYEFGTVDLGRGKAFLNALNIFLRPSGLG